MMTSEERQQNAEHQEWTRRGHEARRQRETLRITQDELHECTGFSITTIRRFENGQCIRKRKVMEHAYMTGLECIALHREAEANLKKHH